MTPEQLALARTEMNTFLRDRGVKHRTVALLDARIRLFISLEREAS